MREATKEELLDRAISEYKNPLDEQTSTLERVAFKAGAAFVQESTRVELATLRRVVKELEERCEILDSALKKLMVPAWLKKECEKALKDSYTPPKEANIGSCREPEEKV